MIVTPHPSFLVGPPSLHPPAAGAANSSAAKAAPTGDPFLDGMAAKFNQMAAPEIPPLGLTEENSVTYLSTGNPCLDFFFHVVPGSPGSSIKERLELAWQHNPIQTLKLICNLRGVRGTGKSDKEGFYTVALWLHGRHPKTLACNVAAIAEFGYFKDLPEILYRLLHGPKIRRTQKNTYATWKKHGYLPTDAPRKKKFVFTGGRERLEGNGKKKKRGRGRGRFGPKYGSNDEADSGAKTRSRKGSHPYAKKINKKAKKGPKNEPKIDPKEECRRLKHEKRFEMAKKAVERIARDPDFRFLYERVADLFADRLRSDMESLKAGETRKISLAAKWCPSIDSSFDRATLICELIARKVFPRESHPEYEGVEDAHYAYRVRDRLRKEVLVPLHKTLELPEVHMAAKQWSSIHYGRVASVAMRNLKKHFEERDGERFTAYLEKVKEGKATIAAGALLPHEVIVALEEDDKEEVAELQWKRMVADLAEKGKLKNCLAICDVSSSMEGLPMEVSVSLGVLVSELSEEPWKGKLITFSSNPQLQEVKGSTLREKTSFVRTMEWGKNTDLQKVFDRILEVAVEEKLNDEQMIKRLFVFSDMEFDQACPHRGRRHGYGYGGDRGYGGGHWRRYRGGSSSDEGSPSVPRTPSSTWDTDYEVIRSKYREKGYGNAVPEVVFWNLRDSKATPVPSRQKGVALVSGFSKNLLKLFLEESGSMDPMTIMEAAIAGQEYQSLVVLD